MGNTTITQAFVLGAGLGTRLRPLTDDIPKPLVPIFQKPLITFAFDHLIDMGVANFFVNTHHRPDRFTEIFPDSAYSGRSIRFFHEPILLETAGGIANIVDSLGEGPLLVYNGDILTDLPLAPLVDEHFRRRNVVTLALRSNADPKHIAFDPTSGRVIDIRNHVGTGARDEFVFTGIYIVDPAFFSLLERGVKKSVIPYFVDLIQRREKVGGVVIDDGRWWDVGNRDAYLQLHRELPSLPFPSYPVSDVAWRTPVHSSAVIDPRASLRGASVVGKDCRVAAEAIVEDTVLWPGSQITSRSELKRCIVRTRQTITGTHCDSDL